MVDRGSSAGVDINVLQCDENISFTDSTADVAASTSQQTVRLLHYDSN